jgi:hypothetical protein
MGICNFSGQICGTAGAAEIKYVRSYRRAASPPSHHPNSPHIVRVAQRQGHWCCSGGSSPPVSAVYRRLVRVTVRDAALANLQTLTPVDIAHLNTVDLFSQDFQSHRDSHSDSYYVTHTGFQVDNYKCRFDAGLPLAVRARARLPTLSPGRCRYPSVTVGHHRRINKLPD